MTHGLRLKGHNSAIKESRCAAVAMAFGAALILLPGCVKPLYKEGASAAYIQGYTAGCDSGYNEASRDGYSQRYRKDVKRYESDSEYRTGWDEGYAVCYEDEWRAPFMLPSGGSVTP